MIAGPGRRGQGVQDAADASRAPGTCFYCFFLDYTDTFTLLFTYYSNDDNWDLGDKGWGLRMVSSPRYVFFFSIFF